jgi:hypothetical protein
MTSLETGGVRCSCFLARLRIIFGIFRSHTFRPSVPNPICSPVVRCGFPRVHRGLKISRPNFLLSQGVTTTKSMP